MKKNLLLSTILMFFSILTFGQGVTVTGTVTDQKGTPLSGATISIRGTTISVQTESNGNFSITAPNSNSRLVISYVGYISQNVNASSGALEIKMAEDPTNLSEVVVTGLGTSIKRSNLANDVGTINAKQLTGSTRTQTLDAAMQGKITGAQISANSGAPGGGFSVRLRGVSSINQNAEPLYIIDGVYANNNQNATGAGTALFTAAAGTGAASFTVTTQDQAPNRMADINPADIENIEILKGSSAAAIYGSRANAGVIIITTKKGKAGKTAISFGQDIGMAKAINLIGMHKTSWNAEKINAGNWGGLSSANMLALFNANGAGATTYDYEKMVYGNTGVISNTRLSLSGGSEKARFYASGTRWSETGIQKRTGYARNSIRLNAELKPYKWWDVTINTSYMITNSDRSFSGNANNNVALGYNLSSLPNWLPQLPVNGVYPANPISGQNPLQIVDMAVNSEKVNRMLASFSNNFHLLRRDNQTLKLNVQGGVDYVSQENVLYMPPELQFQQQRANPGASRFTSTRSRNTNFQALLIYNLTVKDFKLTTSGGAVRFDFNNRAQWHQAEGLPTGTNNPTTGVVQISNTNSGRGYDNGYVVQQEINWDDKIIATGGIRFDRSTLNGEKFKYYSFPKASLAINIANFDFWKLDKVNLVKVRAAYGETGNPPQYGGLFNSMVTFAIGGATGYVAPTVLGNSKIKPENAAEFETGIDLAFLNNRFTLQGTWYYKKVKDFIDAYILSPGTGATNYLTYNIGDFTNKGLEIGLGGAVLNKGKIRWNTNINWWKNETEVTRLIIPEKVVGATGFGAFGTQRIRLGTSPTAWYGTPNVNGRPTQYQDAQPKWQLSWSNNITFLQNFEFSFLLHHSHKNYNSYLGELLTDLGGTSPDWNEKNASGVFIGVARRTGTTGQFIQDATFTKLREVSLYYTVPKPTYSKVKVFSGVEQVRFGVSAQNVFVWTKYKGYDPEAANFGNRPTIAPVDVLNFPSARRMYFHFNVNF